MSEHKDTQLGIPIQEDGPGLFFIIWSNPGHTRREYAVVPAQSIESVMHGWRAHLDNMGILPRSLIGSTLQIIRRVPIHLAFAAEIFGNYLVIYEYFCPMFGFPSPQALRSLKPI